MRIKVNSRRGHFNFVDPSEESVLTTILIYEGEKILKGCVIDTEDIVDSNDPEDLRYEIQQWFSSILYSSRKAKVKEMTNFLKKNADELVRGNRVYKLEQLRKQKDEISDREKAGGIDYEKMDVSEVYKEGRE